MNGPMPSIPQLEEHLAKLEHDTEGRKGKSFKGSFASRRRVDPGIVVQNNGERSCSSITRLLSY